MTKRKFYRTVYQVEVLSEDPTPDTMSLDELHYQITDGSWSGMVLPPAPLNEELDGHQAAVALKGQLSDPEFFNLTDDGDDYDLELQALLDVESATEDEGEEE